MRAKGKTVICLPAYNAEDTIAYSIFKSQKYSSRIVVVDDRSIDLTADMARSCGARVVTHEKSQGFGAAIRTCFLVGKKENADCLVILDPNGRNDPDLIPSLADPILRGEADLVIGSRFKSGARKKSFRKTIGIQALVRAFNLGTSAALTDSESGFRAYSKKALSSIKITTDRSDASMEILLESRDKNFRILEVPVNEESSGRQGDLEHLPSLFRMLRERYPLKFFGWSGIGVLSMTLPVLIYSRARYPDDGLPLGAMFLITFLSILGMFMIFTGIMLQGVNTITNRILKVR